MINETVLKHQLRLIVFILLIASCANDKPRQKVKPVEIKQTDLATNAEPVMTVEDEKQLQELVTELYEWHETKSSNNDFNPAADTENRNYIGLDMKQNNLRLKEIRATNLFDEAFLENYQRIATSLDKQLKTKALEWEVGYLPTFGSGANPWCNCQDIPDDSYWNYLKISIISIENNEAALSWTWGNNNSISIEWSKNFNYRIKASKKNEKWKISYLQGFDYDDFLKIN